MKIKQACRLVNMADKLMLPGRSNVKEQFRQHFKMPAFTVDSLSKSGIEYDVAESHLKALILQEIERP